jgi:hypothetical protein
MSESLGRRTVMQACCGAGRISRASVDAGHETPLRGGVRKSCLTIY